ncbi:MAG: 1-acyl-sn-glycerol-3-phosphate acyltransferase [Bacteroidia bacterium]|nr:1-acyl-sn-glycerol-3-phosphate acyltransferase [Bacteroidia bacterium]
MSPGFCRFVLTKVLGWTMDDKFDIEDKVAVFLGVPHTSIWDFAIGYLYSRANGQKLKVMIKKEAFWGPAGWFLKALGGFPVDRSDATSLMLSLIEEMKQAEEKGEKLFLTICPEGTRKPVRKWKTGYHIIARQADCPVYLSYFDWKTKHVGCGEKFELTDNARSDTDRIQKRYEEMGVVGKFPENFITH